jgi:hypothetical protein
MAVSEARFAVLENDVKWIRETLKDMSDAIKEQAGLPNRVLAAEALAKEAKETARNADEKAEKACQDVLLTRRQTAAVVATVVLIGVLLALMNNGWAVVQHALGRL